MPETKTPMLKPTVNSAAAADGIENIAPHKCGKRPAKDTRQTEHPPSLNGR
ncbi:hypothetical protein [Candidatus Villigracilis saccharophilus]|uniref:hypothetical protein n=1 Tax=Candidatus Villigracilis saccharophilus TaxID=3140684 RepID=UPI003137280A|nr:hypothetical protein [Anaerolineales bacterium]